jgi:hypothetical protein
MPDTVVLHEILGTKLARWNNLGGSAIDTALIQIDGEIPASLAAAVKREIDVLIPKTRVGSNGWGLEEERELVTISTSIDRLLKEDPDISFDWLISINGTDADVERAETILMDGVWTHLEVVDRNDREATKAMAAGSDFDVEAAPDEMWLAVERLQAAGIVAFLLDYTGEDIESFDAALLIEEGEEEEEADDDSEEAEDSEDDDDSEESEDDDSEESEDDEEEDEEEDDSEESEDDEEEDDSLPPWDGKE